MRRKDKGGAAGRAALALRKRLEMLALQIADAAEEAERIAREISSETGDWAGPQWDAASAVRIAASDVREGIAFAQRIADGLAPVADGKALC
jgi:hypothetical protein